MFYLQKINYILDIIESYFKQMKTIYLCIDLLSMIQSEKYDTCIILLRSMIQKLVKVVFSGLLQTIYKHLF